MLTLIHTVAGTETTIFVPQDSADAAQFLAWLAANRNATIALDTETTGLHIYGRDYAVRTVQFGTASTAWVLRVDLFQAVITKALATHAQFVAHNSAFDLLSLDRTRLAPLELMLPKTWDTYILAHLLDSRAAGEDGSPGLSLKALASLYVDPNASDGQADLQALGRSLGRTKATMWSHPALVNYEVYYRYAGLDVIYTARLLAEIGPIVKSLGLTGLALAEHEILGITTRMTQRGILIDVPYTERLRDRLNTEAEQNRAIARRYGVENINSVNQVRNALLAQGVELTERTATGNLSVGRDALLPLAGLTPYWTPIPDATPNPLAAALVHAKRADKWSTAYAQAFLDLRDEHDRIHPGIQPLAARTGRMSISTPPLQQLPAGDWTVRRAFIADPGHVFVSSDFSQVELRVIAANAGVANMIDAIKSNTDLHDRTANLIWGEGNWTKKQRGIGKNVAFCRAYGGGPARVSKTAGIDLAQARTVVNAFNEAYPEINAYAEGLQAMAAGDRWTITTAYGRRLPLSRDRSYAALNYDTQSTARDLFTDALRRIARAGHDRTMVLPVHDEIITQWPIEAAEEGAAVIQSLMTTTFKGVPIDADSQVCYGGSWGSHPDFKIPPTEDYIPSQHKETA